MRNLVALFILVVVCKAQELNDAEIRSVQNLQDESIFCIRTDRFRPNLILICTRRGLVSFNPSRMTYQTLAGYVQFKGTIPVEKYRDGPNEQAMFDWIYDVQQLDDTTYIVTDFYNDCLRNISSDFTSTYAGVCEAGGRLRNGPTSSAIFDGPSGLLYLERLSHLLVADRKNNALRLIDTNTLQVRTIVQNNGLKMPSYLSCLGDSCLGRIFVTIEHGVIDIDLSNRTAVIIAGGDRLSSRGASRSLPETVFEYPNGIVSLNSSTLLVMNGPPNRNVYELNLLTNRSTYFINAGGIYSPWSIGLHGHFLYIGDSSKGGLSRVKIAECDSSEDCSNENENSLLTPRLNPLNPNRRPSTSPDTTTGDSSDNVSNNQLNVIAGSAIGCTLLVVVAAIVGVILYLRAKRRGFLLPTPPHHHKVEIAKETIKSPDPDIDYEMYATVDQYHPEPQIQTRVDQPYETDSQYFGDTEYSYPVIHDFRRPERPLPLTPLNSDSLIGGESPMVRDREYVKVQKEAEPAYADKDRVSRKSGEESDADISDTISYMGPDME